MNTRDIDTFTARLGRFTDHGASFDDAERLADKLVQRDRQRDGRRACLECTKLHGVGRWRCGDAGASGLVSGLPADLVTTLQHCHGFAPAVA